MTMAKLPWSHVTDGTGTSDAAGAGSAVTEPNSTTASSSHARHPQSPGAHPAPRQLRVSMYFNWEGRTKKAGVSPNPLQYLLYHPNVPMLGGQGLLSCVCVQGWQKESPWDGVSRERCRGICLRWKRREILPQRFFLPFLHVSLSVSERE